MVQGLTIEIKSRKSMPSSSVFSYHSKRQISSDKRRMDRRLHELSTVSHGWSAKNYDDCVSEPELEG